MKYISHLILIFLISFNTYGSNSESIDIFNEIRDEHRTTGVSITFREWNRNSLPVLFFGFSASSIKSNLALEKENRNQIYPIYGYMGITLNYPIAPFIEVGMDLGDALEDKVFEGDALDVDIYYSLGLTLKYKQVFDISLYHKTYNLFFNEFMDTSLQNTNIDISGISISFYL